MYEDTGVEIIVMSEKKKTKNNLSILLPTNHPYLNWEKEEMQPITFRNYISQHCYPCVL